MVTLTGSHAFSQFIQDDVILDFTGSYVESYSSSGVTTSKYSGIDKTLDLKISIGLCISKNLTAGLGLQYGHIQNETRFQFYYYDNFILVEKLETKATVFAPLVYLRYNRPVIGKLWFSAELSTMVGKVSTQYESMNMGAKMYPDTMTFHEIEPGNFLRGSEHHENSKILSVSLKPVFSYFLTEKIGLRIGMGGIQYNSYNFEAHEWQVTLNPSSWEYGFFVRFGKKM